MELSFEVQRPLMAATANLSQGWARAQVVPGQPGFTSFEAAEEGSQTCRRRFGNKIPLHWGTPSVESFPVAILHGHQSVVLLMSRLSFLTTPEARERGIRRHRSLWQAKSTSRD